MDSDGERKIPSTLSESLLETFGMFLKVIGGSRRAGPMGRIAHFSKLGCSLETVEKDSMHWRICFKVGSLSP